MRFANLAAERLERRRQPHAGLPDDLRQALLEQVTAGTQQRIAIGCGWLRRLDRLGHGVEYG